MSKCPNCGGDMEQIENGCFECVSCHKKFVAKLAENKQEENAQNQEAVAERNAESDAESLSKDEEIKELKRQLEVEQLKRRVAELERGPSKGPKEKKPTPKWVIGLGNFFKKYGLKIVLPAVLGTIVFITLMSCFCGLRGIYVNENNPAEFYSFTGTTYEYHYSDRFGQQLVDKGTWSRKGDKIIFKDAEDAKMKDELDDLFGGAFGDLADEFSTQKIKVKNSWNKFTLSDGGVVSSYRRVNIICYRDNVSKIKVTFDPTNGWIVDDSIYENSGSTIMMPPRSVRVKIGSTVEIPEVRRSGYTFKGWYTTRDGWKNPSANKKYEDEMIAWEKITLYANWQGEREHMIKFDAAGGKFDSAPIVAQEGDEVFVPNSFPVKKGSYFLGWECDGEIYEIGKPFKMFNKDVTFRAVYSEEPYVMSFKEIDNGNAYSVSLRIANNTSGLTVSIPSSHEEKPVTSIEHVYCWTRNQVNLPDSITKIQNEAFAYSKGLVSLTIPENVVYIGKNAFAWCSHLEEVTYYAKNCADLTEQGVGGAFAGAGVDGTGVNFYFGDKVEYIPEYLLYVAGKQDISNIKSVSIGRGVKGIGIGAILCCPELERIEVADGNTAYRSVGNCLIEIEGKKVIAGCGVPVIPNDGSVTQIEQYAFAFNKKIVDFVIPNGVTSIGEYAFASCSYLKMVSIPNGVTSIERHVFARCESLVRVTIPDSVTNIEAYAFYCCYSLESVAIPDNVTSVGNMAFWGCDKLQFNEYDNACYLGNETNSYIVFMGLKDENVTNLTINSKTKVVASSTCMSAKLESVIIPDSVTSLGNEAFYGCTGLKSVTIGSGVTHIGKNAFRYCRNLEKINFNATHCDDLVNKDAVFRDAGESGSGIMVIFGDNVESIPKNLFGASLDYSPHITNIIIGSGVSSIDDYAFSSPQLNRF